MPVVPFVAPRPQAPPPPDPVYLAMAAALMRRKEQPNGK